MKKTGILGGTFNPVHNGHIKIAKAAKEQYGLDRVIFLTSGNPPHKRDEEILDAKIRHIMVKRAISGIDGFCACDWEVKREEYSYTLSSLLHFKELYPNDDLYFIIGGDSLRDFNTWYKPHEILKLCTLLVYDREGGSFVSDIAKPITGAKIDASSTDIRNRVREGEDIRGLVPECVRGFIERNHLYKEVSSFEEKLKTMLKPERYIHSLGVRDTAKALAEKYGADSYKAEIAGLLHDNAKNMDNPLERCRDLEVELDEFEMENPALIHAKLGAETVKCEFLVNDKEIVNAIRFHTVGYPGMSLLEKIIFVADLVEPNRSFQDAKILRELAFSDIDRVVLECVKSTVEVNKKRGAEVHPNAYKIIEWLS